MARVSLELPETFLCITQRSSQTVAHAKTGMVFLDYRERRLAPVAVPFLALFGAVPAGG